MVVVEGNTRIFYIVKRYLELQKFITPILLKTTKIPDILNKLLSLLQSLEFITKEYFDQKYTYNRLKICVSQLKAVDPEVYLIIKKCKAFPTGKMSKQFDSIEVCSPIVFVIYLNPLFKSLNSLNATLSASHCTEMADGNKNSPRF